ncbi:MAG TPA: biotin--[acetyl-CoA-carboxylase] ligase [Solirubrobacteraceae bacterium]|jgi:BirA family biotin operon repressor/biotin-[acetyl-CoA-carboxylase] ligase|nr:biotin--[acetyl-CoA-carboxylase] ligase [Solirubrobacteraceae bacterium]
MRDGAPLGHPRLHLRRTDSTNKRARALAQAGAPHGTLVSASEQTAGRGRQGRRWSAPAGSALLMSLLLRDGAASGVPERPPLALAAAVAVCEAIEPVSGIGAAAIKWPNDIVSVRTERPGADRRAGMPSAAGSLAKLAGILIESRPQEEWAVVGIGVNVSLRVEQLPPELHGAAASLGLPAAEIEPLLARLLAALARRLAQPPAAVLDAWRARDALRGREIAWADGHGRAAGIDEEGRLLVARGDGGRVALDAGEVHLAAV